MDTIKVLKVEPKFTKNNKPYKACEVECQGEVRKVNLWSNFPDFANIHEGSVITARMVKDGQYWNIQAEEDKPRGGAGTAYKSQSIAKAQEQKAEMIKESQGRKEESIALAGAQRDAVLIVTMIYNNLEYPNQSEDAIKDHIIRWRNWFLSDEFKKGIPPF